MSSKNYNMTVFYKGMARYHVRQTASTPLQAFKLASKPSTFSHVVVVDKVLRRYDAKGKKITGQMSVCKTLWKGTDPSIILMIENYPEVYSFKDKDKRDKIFEEMNKCIISMSAGSAKAEAELTGIIASLDEISGTKKSLTPKKTSSGYAMTATCKATRTPESIAKSFGTPSVGGSGMNTWFNGLEVCRSSLNRTLLVTVNLSNAENRYMYPGISTEMKKYQGKSIKVKSTSNHAGIDLFKGEDATWIWHPNWLDKTHAYCKVVKAGKNGDEVKERHIGKIYKFTKCGCGCGMYNTNVSKYAKLNCLETGYTRKDYENQTRPLTEQEKMSSLLEAYKKGLANDK